MIQPAYLAIDLLALAFPMAFTLAGPWRAETREWFRILAAVLGMAAPFILWDAAFAGRGIWSFNPDYLSGLRLFTLPLEEVLFFFCIPFACLFIYRTVKSRPGLRAPRRLLRPLWLCLAAGCAAAALLSEGRAYSQSAFGVAALGLCWHAWRLPAWSGHFLSALGFHYLPFFLINGLLTALPVVLYDGSEILGYRLGSIPVEDVFYSLSLLLGNVSLYEALAPRRGGSLPA